MHLHGHVEGCHHEAVVVDVLLALASGSVEISVHVHEHVRVAEHPLALGVVVGVVDAGDGEVPDLDLEKFLERQLGEIPLGGGLRH